MPILVGMAVGYTAFVLDMDTQRLLRETHGADVAGKPVGTLRMIDRLHATREDRRAALPEKVKVVGIHHRDAFKVLLVEVDGDIRRADGGFYHIALAMPEAGLHIKTVDEMASVLLSSVPEDGLRNFAGGHNLPVKSGFVVGVERPRAVQAPAAKPAAAVSRFMRAG